MTKFAETIVGSGGVGLGTVTGLPLEGPIYTLFGVKDDLHPAGHAGVDISPPAGTPIRAPAPGTVCDVFALPLRGNQWDAFKNIFGNCVIIDHGDAYTLYGHMRDAPSVREGQPVKAGDLIGHVGSTGFSTGPHLHWGMAPHDNRYLHFPPAGPIGFLLNPLDFVEQQQATPTAPATADVQAAIQHLEDALRLLRR